MTTEITGIQKIKSATIENYKGIKHVEITASEKAVYLIGGKNGNGKTSVIDALKTCLSGKKFATTPVRIGQKHAAVSVKLNDFTINIHIDTDGKITPVVVHLATGKKVTSPKKVLQSMFGEFAMDPAEFSRMKAVDQIAALRAITVDDDGKPITFDDLDKEYETLYDQRKLDKSKLKDCQIRLQNNPEIKDAPAAEQSSDKLIEDLDVANTHNQNLQQLDNVIESKVRESTAHEKEVDRLKTALKKAETAVKDADRAVEHATSERKKAGSPVETSGIEDQLRSLDETNAKWRDQQNHLKYRKECTAQIDVVTKVEADLVANKETRNERLASSRFPVEGLTFDDTGIKLNGVPFNDSSGAEQLAVSFKVALSGRPQMPIVFIDNGELFDDESLAIIEQEAEKLDAQVFMAIGSRLETYDLFVEAGERK